MPVPFDIGPTHVEASASAGAAVMAWVGDGADRIAFDPIAVEGIRIAPAAAGVDVRAPRGARVTGRIELSPTRAALTLAELRAGWEAPDGYGGAGIGQLHVPLSSDRRYEVEGMALSFRPVLSRVGLPVHAPGVQGRIAWPDRVQLSVGSVWTSPSLDAPTSYARLDITPLGPPPRFEDGDVEGLYAAAGGGIALQRAADLAQDTWIAGDVVVGWRSLAVDLGWISRIRGDLVADDQWVAARSRIARLPGETDLYFAARMEWVDGIVEGELARNLATGRLSWRMHPINRMGDDRDAWAALYAEGTFSREVGIGGVAPETGEALVLSAERANDWFGVGAWLRW